MKKYKRFPSLLFYIVCILLPNFLLAQLPNLIQYVNTLQGTNSSFELTHGNTYPTTALPFAVHTWTPQTGKNGDGWKYQYTKNTIRGFQQAHQCSSWTNDYAVFSFMPGIDTLIVNEDDRALTFDHKNEIAKPHYYSVQFDNAIRTEMSPSERGVHLRFSFPKGHKSFLVLDGYTGLSNVHIDVANRTIRGFVNNGRGFKKGWKNYFIAVFDRPFLKVGTWCNENDKTIDGNTDAVGKGIGAYVKFENGITVEVKVASSYISEAQAKLNLNRELGNDETLEQTKAKAAQIWNKHLGKILIEGNNEANKATFYSCFFRASLFARKFYEIDKQGNPYYFSPYDGKVHKGYMFTDTGFWDTFRAQFPLNALLYPKMHGRYMQALLDAYDQCGWLPSWSFPSEAGSMVGNHAISLLSDAWVKGIRTFDPHKALEAYYHESNNKGPWGPANGRDGYQFYTALGYVPYPDVGEATAKTLEYAYDDFCGYTLAKQIGDEKFANAFHPKINNYKNVFNPATKFMQGRDNLGRWSKDFDPVEWGGPFTEGNAWHWVWSVFHDINGLINLLGGNQEFCSKLDSVFTVPNTVKVGTYGNMIHEMKEMVVANMGQYAHGNQPIQHMPYLYNYAGQPWKSQQRVREVMHKLYNATENGYPGDEDQGQTSSWYVLSALGFYSVCPGTNQYVLGSPLFEKITITLEDGKKFVIKANHNNEYNVYIQKALLNNHLYNKNFITYQDINGGGVLQFEMSDQPNYKRGTAKSDLPFSFSKN